MTRIFLPVAFILVILAGGCTSREKVDEDALAKKQYVAERNPVEVMVLKRSVFKKELVSNGKLKALQKSVLKFRTGGELVFRPVSDGSHVEKGAVIARLGSFAQEQALAEARLQLENARVELQDFLLMKGYGNGNSGDVPPAILETGKIRSGMLAAELAVKTATYNLEQVKLIAPFTGKVAGLQYNLHEEVAPGTDFCTLIDDTRFQVVFPVLETELTQIRLGKEVKIIPFAVDTVITGRITEINPVVDENGQVQVRAVVRNPGMLLEGMNVKVLVENAVPGQLVVPKSAVILRQNLEVLFRYTAGTAYWTYVKILYENSSSYAVTANTDRGATLNPGDTVIISGNLNLAHESKVVIK